MQSTIKAPVVRDATAEDELIILAIAERVGLRVDARAELGRAFARLWVIEEQNDVLGFLVAWLMADEMEIIDVGVEPVAQGKGLGSCLLSTALEQGRVVGARSAFLEVRKSNQHARALYVKHGFTHVGERKGYYSDGEDALLFRCCMTVAG